ncbi:BMP family ABC transporter substrate-binding protein [Anaerobacillus alkalidiazotrophicus]|uniref:BMP family ABC transporter substrate-binding protein n=1 Tax=Anaerobacillus alkalidiazotrophicus TaxID=472963 RepID=A0A1S2M1U8_9BACI|nr:BMP family ABC transporter substrate-binding protein [Anaerobacillus alkalidiazotrophicus]OIJ18480.1 BMP family ABC transporter substrate-binding protein [Anaerobacillus alkalidiazotrophicus]OIJ19959.1 BMP family ABC transporter substrate-binding protein [Anaerobacillus alkalidiazotrophicus]
MSFFRISLIVTLLLISIGCSTSIETNMSTKVGLLLPSNIDDQGWNSKGYKGLLNIHSKMNVDVFYKEEINSMEKVNDAILEYEKLGVNLVFGHGKMYAMKFLELKDQYPHMHFIAFNGDVSGENITSLHFEGYAMGFFAGILASEMSETNVIGVIAAYPWQPEVEGFVEGSQYQNPDVDVIVNYVSSWGNIDKAIELYNEMKLEGVDVFYPAGDGYHIPVIEEVRKHGLYVIGYVGDQSDLGQSTVLTSTIQHVDQLYELVAEEFFNGKLSTGNRYFDFAEGVISLGAFSPEVPEDIQVMISDEVQRYIDTGKLPNEK